MKYAVIQTGGKQYKVCEGDELTFEKLEEKEGKSINFSEVLLVVDEKKKTLGQPVIKNIVVKAKVLEHLKGKKIRVATYKAKSRYRRVKGHRQNLTKVLIEKIATQSKVKQPVTKKPTSNN